MPRRIENPSTSQPTEWARACVDRRQPGNLIGRVGPVRNLRRGISPPRNRTTKMRVRLKKNSGERQSSLHQSALQGDTILVWFFIETLGARTAFSGSLGFWRRNIRFTVLFDRYESDSEMHPPHRGDVLCRTGDCLELAVPLGLSCRRYIAERSGGRGARAAVGWLTHSPPAESRLALLYFTGTYRSSYRALFISASFLSEVPPHASR